MTTGTELKNFRESEIDPDTGKSYTQQSFSALFDIKRSALAAYESGRVGIDIGLVKRIEEKFKKKVTNSNKDDLATISTPTGKLVKAPKGRLSKRTPGGIINFYDTDFAAGDIDFHDDSQAIQPAYTMDIPEFAGCTAFRTYNNSMEKLIKSGDILFGTEEMDWQSHLEYGQIYGIVCTDRRKYLKYIRKAKEKEDSHFLLKSENNVDYDDFLLPKNKIKSIWLIHGWLNKRT